MAQAVDFRRYTPRNSREDLIRKLSEAPEEHAEAILSAYELLQRMHEKGLLNAANDLLSASDTIIEKTADAVSSTPAINALRSLLLLANLAGHLDADQLRTVLNPGAGAPPSLWDMFKRARATDVRRGLSAGLGLLALFGKALGHGE